MNVMKFGGSSLASGERMLAAALIIKKFSHVEGTVIVASAMYNVTDELISIFQKYKDGHYEDALEEMGRLYKKHKQALDELGLEENEYKSTSIWLLDSFKNLGLYLNLHKDFSEADYDYVVSYGERLSSYLLSKALNKVKIPSQPIDASCVIVASEVFRNAKALLQETRLRAKELLLPLLSKKIVPVVTGFFAATKNGVVVTLGRGGSDYSAAVLANVLDVQEVILWKEVDGIYSGDPKKDIKAMFYSELTYQQALQLAKRGAKILHPLAMKPVAQKGIVVRVKNTFKPDQQGTKIWRGNSGL